MADANVSPGFLTASAAAALNAGMVEQENQRRAMALQGQDAMRPLTPVSLTARDSGTGLYSWTEQMFDSTGSRIARPGGRTGTATSNPVRLLGGTKLTTLPADATVMRCIGRTTGGVLYEGVAFAVEGMEEITVDYVAKVCVNKTFLSGAFRDIDLTFEHKKYKTLGVPLDSETYCTTDDEDCCPTVQTDCCDEPLPRCFRITFANGTGYWACLDNYTAWMQYDDALGYWYIRELNREIGTGVGNDRVVTCGVSAGTELAINGTLTCSELGLTLNLGIVFDDGTPPLSSCWIQNVNILFVHPEFCSTQTVTYTGQALDCGSGPPGESAGTVDVTIAAADCDDMGPVDTGGGGGSCASCVPCPDGDTWEINVGVGDLTCSSSPSGHGFLEDCTFTSTSGWILFHDVTGWNLINPGSGIVMLPIDDGSWDCDGPNTFSTYTSGSGGPIILTRP